MAASRSLRSILSRVLLIACVLAAIAGAATSAVWTVAQGEQGVVLRGGAVARIEGPGIHVTLPWPIETLVVVQTGQLQTMPIGFKLSDKMNGVPPSPDEVQWLTGDTNIVELQATALWSVKDPTAWLFGVADGPRAPGDFGPVNQNERRFLIRKVAEAVLTDLIATHTVDDVLGNGKTELQLKALDRVQTELDRLGLGVSISAINVTDVNPPLGVIASFNDVSTARADKERLAAEADGYTKKLLPQARAAANQVIQDAETYRNDVVNQAQGAAASFTRLLDEVNKNRELSLKRMWFESAGRILSKGKKIVFEPTADGKKFRIYLDG